MSSSLSASFPRLLLLTAVLMSGPVACKRSVSDAEFSSTRSKKAEAEQRYADLDKEMKDLNAQVKELTNEYGGPQFDAKVNKATGLKGEKEELISIKTEIDQRVANFNNEAKKLRESVAGKP